MSLWGQIKQRRVTQIVLTYLAGGSIALASVDQVVDREVLPLVVYEVGLTLYLIGILAALIIGWYHGERGEQKAPLAEIVMLGLIGIFALGASAKVIRSAQTEATLQDALADSGLDLRRLAIDYFVDMSSDGSVQAVADGITEGLISILAQVPELDVASRNASLEVRDLDASPDSIARVLDVGTVVDGTVDRVGDELRVTVRVLEGATGIPLFRDSYTWPDNDIASVSSELATEIANAFREQLGVEIRLREARAAAPNAAAWLQVARAERFIKDAAESVQHGDAQGIIDAFDAAEAELVAAQESAPDWAGPLVLRSQIAYEFYILAGSTDELLETLALSVEHADAALALDPVNAAALEWRGTALYRRWLLQAEDEDILDDVFDSARGDLERSLTLDRRRASVNSTLSHLYYQVDDWAQAVLAARAAYEQDAFLDVIDGVLWRLYTASYDLGEYNDADQWCAEGNDRFPDGFRFVQCQIFLMTMPGAEPDIDRAWRLHDELLPLLTERPEYFEALSKTVIGAIVGRAGLPDSAQAVFEEARIGTDVDPERELLSIEAAMRSVIGDVEGSIEVLQRYMIANPDRFPGQHWWWRNVETSPDFQRLQAIH